MKNRILDHIQGDIIFPEFLLQWFSITESILEQIQLRNENFHQSTE